MNPTAVFPNPLLPPAPSPRVTATPGPQVSHRAPLPDLALPARSPRPAQGPVPVPAWGDPRPYARQLESLLGSCRRQARLATVLLVEVLPADADAARALMQAMGQRLRSRVRATDEVAQLGDACFAVLLVDVGERGSNGVRQRLDDALRQPYRVGAELAQPLLRIGRAVHGLDGHHAADLLRAATLAVS